MKTQALIAGKDPAPRGRWQDYVLEALCGVPVFVGIFGAEAIESTVGSIVSVVLGFLVAMGLMWKVGKRRMNQPLQFFGGGN